ncbi:hypothetical protein BJX66DRAFT_352770 [Aspergillus keveii]|uniref:4-coumarate-CoA ligase n=1 Tax=Aspergillus keveii TaxID=714993 RepID=A0ABR4GK45_9EURO
MPIHSRWTVPIPEVSLQTWLFGSSNEPLSDQKIFLDADNPKTNYLTLSGYRLMSKRIALGLQRAGLQRGDRVLVFSGNNIYYPNIFMGIIMAGGIFTGAGPAATSAELARQLQDSGARFLIAATDNIAVALEAASRAGLPKDHIYAFDGLLERASPGDLVGVKYWTDILANAAEAEKFAWVEPEDPRSTTCCLNYSSGTTGAPKGVKITHYSYVANGQVIVHIAHLDPNWNAELKSKSNICCMPMYHAAGQTFFIVNQSKLQVPTYVMPAYSFEKLLRHIHEFRITCLLAAPPVLLKLAKSPLTEKHDLKSLDQVVCGTAPLAPDVAETVDRKLWPNGGKSFVRQGWGMTEFTCNGTLWASGDDEKSTSIGELVPNASLKIMDVEGTGQEITTPHTSGELWIAGPAMMKGYWRNPTATQEIIVEENGVRWLKTGDIVYVDRAEPGAKIFITDRIKELIKVRGFQVSPAELEATLLTHQSVVDAGVVGVVVDGNKVPRAYIVKRPDSDVTANDIANWIKGQVANYKWLKGGVVFVESIPRNPTGKILRRILRERAKREVGDLKGKLA